MDIGFKRAGYIRRLIISKKDLFNYKDYYIEDCYRSGMSEKEIVRRIRGMKIFDETFVEDIFEQSMADLLRREKEWDVKISDYFLETYRTMQFFWDPGHPADHVIKEIVVRLVRLLGISIDKTSIEDLSKDFLNHNEIPIYQCVKDILHLEWREKNELRENSCLKLTSKDMDLDEYVKEYIFFSKYAEHCVDLYNKSIITEWKNNGRLVVFGAGNWFGDYMRHYGTEYVPDLVVDNNEEKWGSVICGVTVENPRKIQDDDKIIICCFKSEKDIERQVYAMGVETVILYRPDKFIEKTILNIEMRK